MIDDKLTDEEIIKGLKDSIEKCYIASPLLNMKFDRENNLLQYAIDLINRQQTEIEDITNKLECLLCHATGSRLSYSTYPLETMYYGVNDYIEDCCDEARTEAVEEFMDLFEEKINEIDFPKYAVVEKMLVICKQIMNDTVKEMVG